MASFLDYYNAELAKRGAPTQGKSSGGVSLSSLSSAASQKKAQAASPLGVATWVIDMLDRPRNAVANVAKNAIDRGVAAGEAFSKGDVGSGAANTAGAVFGAVPALLQGLTSNNPADKHSSADLIEYGTDTIGKAVDPNYVDRKDNVNTAFKGLNGFLGDVATDPLTYIPATWGAKAAKGVLKLADAPIKALSEGVFGAPVPVSKLAKDAVAAADGERAATKLVTDVTDEAAKAPRVDITGEDMLNSIPTPGAKAAEKLAPVESQPGASFIKPAVEKAVQSTAGGLKTPILEGLLKPVTEAKAAPLKFPGGAGKISPEQAVQDLVASSEARSPVQEFLGNLSKAKEGVSGADVPATLNEWARAIPDAQKFSITGTASSKSMAEIRQLQAQYGQAMQKVAGGDQAAKAVAARLSQQVAPYVKILKEQYGQARKVVAKPDTTYSAFQAMVAHDYQNVERTLGPELSDFLSRNHTPEKFDHLVNAISGVVNAGPDTADILRSTDQNLSKLLSDRLGVPRRQVPSSTDEVSQRIDELFNAADDYQKGVSDTVMSVVRQQAEKGNWPFEITKDGLKVHRTTLAPGKGLGKYADQLNTFTQRSIKASLDTHIKKASELVQRARGTKALSFSGSAGKARTLQYKDALLRALDDVDKNLDALGLATVIGHGSKTSMLSLSEVYRGLLSTAAERGTQDLADLALFNWGTSVLDTHLMESVNNALHGASREEVLALLTSNKKIGAKGNLLNETTPNNLASPKGSWAYASKQAAQGVAEKTGGTVVQQGKAWAVQYDLANELTDIIMESSAMLKIRASENLAAYTAKSAAEAHGLATEAVKRMDQAVASPSVVATTKVLGGTDRLIADDAAKTAATPDAMAAAQRLAGGSLDRATQVDLQALRKALPAAAAATSVKELKKVSDGIATDIEREVTDALKKDGSYHQPGESPDPDFPSVQDSGLDEAFAEAGQQASKKTTANSPKIDLAENPEKFIDAFGRRIQDPYGKIKWKAQEWFNQNFNAANVHPIFAAFQNSMAMRTNYVSNQLKAINALALKNGDTEGRLVQVAFQNLQRGAASTDPTGAQIETMLAGVLTDYFDLEAKGAVANSFLRIGQVDAVNAMLAQKGVKFEFNAAAATTGKKLDTEALADQWKGWDVTDPLDFIHRMNLAREELSINAGVARSFMDLADANGALSRTPKAGFVEITSSGRSRFAAHIPESTFVRKDLAEELQHVESVLRTSRKFEGELGHFIDTVYAPILNGWKRSITIMRPGHHVRNYIGSTSATWVRRGFNEFRRSHVDAYKMLASRNNYTGVDMRAAAAYNGLSDLPQGGDLLLSMGKRGDLTVDEAYAYLANNGAYPGFRVHEDFLASEGSISKVMNKITLSDTKVGELAGHVSEYTDHLTRSQHFMQALRQDAKKYPGKSKDQLMESALKETLKYHPDASMLTPFESKLRYVVPFYTWFSKIMPALVESLLMHPGRVTMPVKASYALATTLGLDPNNLTDPFPSDQQFPSFIKSNPLGPQLSMFGSYLRVNPGIAHLDVMNTFGVDPFRGLLGMTSPLLRVPVELATGGSMSTGGRISDQSDYLDQSIPGVNYLANITGFSPTGSVASILQGQGLDPQKGFQAKADGTTNKSGLDQGISAFNWLTGLGVQNLSRPNYINYAEIEKRNQAGAKNG